MSERSERHVTAHPRRPAGGPGVGTSEASVAFVVLLIAAVPRRLQLLDALRRTGHRVAVGADPQAWPVDRRSAVLLTDESPAAGRVRARFAATAPGTPVVVLLDDPTPARYREALASGATAVPCDYPDEDVLLAVDAAARHFAVIPATAARMLAGHDGDRPVVTDREASWLRALAGGSTVAGLARTVGYPEQRTPARC